ncbi:hypothetical protein JavanS327_0003 [Streptococcus satellite phage Javan327]|nr:hypothetical protein JavanS327_0003 [Streptococcus satellite phage Javan327]
MIKNNLANILKTKEKTAAWLSVKTGITPAALSKIVNNSSTKIDYITLNKICLALKIEPKDFFDFLPYDYEVESIYDNKDIKVSLKSFELDEKPNSSQIESLDFYQHQADNIDIEVSCDFGLEVNFMNTPMGDNFSIWYISAYFYDLDYNSFTVSIDIDDDSIGFLKKYIAPYDKGELFKIIKREIISKIQSNYFDWFENQYGKVSKEEYGFLKSLNWWIGEGTQNYKVNDEDIQIMIDIEKKD